jgi:hypothetical protein
MASFALEDFVGNGVLQAQLDNLVADGWDDVPTLKMMSYQDMDTLELSQLQRVSKHHAQFNLSNSVSIIIIIIFN